MEEINTTIRQLRDEFDALGEVEQWEFVLKHKNHIEMTLNKDNITFVFVDEEGTYIKDDSNYFSLDAWIGYDYGVRILLPLIGINAECC